MVSKLCLLYSSPSQLSNLSLSPQHHLSHFLFNGIFTVIVSFYAISSPFDKYYFSKIEFNQLSHPEGTNPSHLFDAAAPLVSVSTLMGHVGPIEAWEILELIEFPLWVYRWRVSSSCDCFCRNLYCASAPVILTLGLHHYSKPSEERVCWIQL